MQKEARDEADKKSGKGKKRDSGVNKKLSSIVQDKE
jgi:hypothetical protein